MPQRQSKLDLPESTCTRSTLTPGGDTLESITLESVPNVSCFVLLFVCLSVCLVVLSVCLSVCVCLCLSVLFGVVQGVCTLRCCGSGTTTAKQHHHLGNIGVNIPLFPRCTNAGHKWTMISTMPLLPLFCIGGRGKQEHGWMGGLLPLTSSVLKFVTTRQTSSN